MIRSTSCARAAGSSPRRATQSFRPPLSCFLWPRATAIDYTAMENFLALAVHGSRAEGSGWRRHTVYMVRVSWRSMGGTNWRTPPPGTMWPGNLIARRYSSFRALHARLVALGSFSRFPAPRRLLRSATWVVREREALLQRFLHDCAAAASSSPRVYKEVAVFLGLLTDDEARLSSPDVSASPIAPPTPARDDDASTEVRR